MNFNKFGLSLLDCVNNNNGENKKIFMKNINEYRDKKEELHNQYLEDISYYISNYENKRIENQNLYQDYLNRRFLLYKQWKDNKTIGNLQQLISFPRPELNEVPEIYTKKRIISKLK
jgi:hypothetical protein